MPISSTIYLFNQQVVDASPDRKGVYGLYDEDLHPIYYGMSDVSIRDRLQSHLDGNEGPCTQRAHACNWEQCSNPAARERELLTEYQLAYGRLPRCNSRMP